MKRTSTLAAVTRLALRPRTMKAHLSGQLREVRAKVTYSEVYAKYGVYTMITKGDYINNLTLIDTHRAVSGVCRRVRSMAGGMIAGIAELLGPDRQYVLFDSFEGLPPAKEIDGPAALAWQSDSTKPTYLTIARPPRALPLMQCGSPVHATCQYTRVGSSTHCRGTCHPAPIAILRLDGDWYDSTMVCLEALFPYLAPEGVVILDDYCTWDGCRRAVHDYLYQYESLARILQWRDDVTYIKLPTPDPSPVQTAGPE